MNVVQEKVNLCSFILGFHCYLHSLAPRNEPLHVEVLSRTIKSGTCVAAGMYQLTREGSVTDYVLQRDFRMSKAFLGFID